MHYKSSSERLGEALEQARRHWTKSPRPVPPEEAVPLTVSPGMTIALSREAGAHGLEVAGLVAERLNWPVYDRELLVRIAEEMGLHASLLESVDEKHQNWFQECMAAFSPPPVSKYTYVRRLVEAVLSIGTHGNCVIVGRGAAQILPAATTLRVRLVAPLADRVRTMQERLDVPRDEAAHRVEQIDLERGRFVRDHFRLDPAAACNYDLVLNTSRFTLPECTDMIIAALERLRSRKSVTVKPTRELAAAK